MTCCGAARLCLVRHGRERMGKGRLRHTKEFED